MIQLTVRHLTLLDEPAFMAALAETKVTDPNFVHFYESKFSFADYLQDLQNQENGIGLKEGYVRSSCLFGFVDNKIVGRISIRYELTDFLKNVGGHIGYVVVPSFRKKGHATEMLKQTLSIARNSGLTRVLLTCDQDNVGSYRTIEKCGGILENIYSGPDVSVPKKRYWINL